MANEEHSGDHIIANLAGATVPGMVAVGKEVKQGQTVGTMSTQVSDAELADLRADFDAMREQIRTQAPDDKRDPALERLDELEEAVVTDEPDPATAGYVRGWFARNLPQLAGGVVSLVVHPVVGKLVEAAGELVVDQFRKLAGSEG